MKAEHAREAAAFAAAAKQKKGGKGKAVPAPAAAEGEAAEAEEEEEEAVAGRTALHHAASRGDVDAVAKLLDEGADAAAADANSWHALHEATRAGSLPVVSLLLQVHA